jgi:TPP-dependent pyruvate/acetoin dehydrogenase alpha subunit
MSAGNGLTASNLIEFEAEVAAIFNDGKIRAPVHLSGGNEDVLIDIFKDIQPNDFVFSTWRSHYHALLHGIPRDKLMSAIVGGKSISLNFPEHNFYSSAIVGGMLPIATGVAWAAKRKETSTRVYVFVGDMASRGGLYQECYNYSFGHDLPIVFVSEENNLSVCSPTKDVWGKKNPRKSGKCLEMTYSYSIPWPHSGAGKRVEF